MDTIKEILIRRDGLTDQEAKDQIDEARRRMYELADKGSLLEAMNICQQEFGLEPDYLIELL